MSQQEYTITGHLKETTGTDRQTYLLHGSFWAESKEKAIAYFHEHFKPDLEVIKIYSVIDNHGNQI